MEHGDQVQTCFPGCGPDVSAGVSSELEDGHVFIDEDARRRVARQCDSVRRAFRVRFGRPPFATRRFGGKVLLSRAQPEMLRAWLFRENLKSFVDLVEQVGSFIYSLADAQQEHATGFEGIMENRENAPLRGASQVNQEIATAYQIHPGKG